jgi:spermidine/putrescine-binding protein
LMKRLLRSGLLALGLFAAAASAPTPANAQCQVQEVRHYTAYFYDDSGTCVSKCDAYADNCGDITFSNCRSC